MRSLSIYSKSWDGNIWLKRPVNRRLLLCIIIGTLAVQASLACGTAAPENTSSIPASDTGTKTSPAGAVRTVVSTVTDAADIRAINWKQVTGARPLVREVEKVIYADLTGDRREQAIVMVRLEGSGAFIDYYVFSLDGGELLSLFEKSGVELGDIELGPLPRSFTETTSEYGPGDPNCCPGMLKKTTYQWSEQTGTFVEVSVDYAPNTTGSP